MGWFYFYDLKDYAKSIESSKKGLESDNNAVWIRCNLAIAYLHNGNFEEATREYLKAVEIIVAGTYSDGIPDKKVLLDKACLADLKDARKVAKGELADRIDEVINMLNKKREGLGGF